MNNKKMVASSKLIIILLIIHGVLAISLINSSLWYSTGIMNMKIPFFFVVFGNILSAIYILIIKRMVEYRNKELELKDTIIKLKESNEIISYLRTHKHDFFNHLQTIRGLMQTNNSDRIIPYIDSIVGRVGNTYQVANISIPEIAVVIMQKVGEASNKLIKTDVEVNTDLKGLKGNPMDYSQILFNLLDNAITALDNQANNDKILGVIVDEDDHNYYFIIENNYPIIPQSHHSKMFNKNFTTKNSEGGMGLFIVKSLVEKYNGSIHLVSEDGLGTSFEIAFPKS